MRKHDLLVSATFIKSLPLERPAVDVFSFPEPYGVFRCKSGPKVTAVLHYRSQAKAKHERLAAVTYRAHKANTPEVSESMATLRSVDLKPLPDGRRSMLTYTPPMSDLESLRY